MNDGAKPSLRILPSAGKILLLGILTCILVAACRVQNVPPPATEPVLSPTRVENPVLTPTPTEVAFQGTISIWHSWDEQKLPALLKAIADFQAQYPSVQFDVQYIPSIDLKAGYIAANIDGYAPSILIGPAEWGPELYELGWAADLSGGASAAFLEGLNPAALDAAHFRQALVGIPVSIEGVVLYRNQRIIPVAVETFPELISQALQATEGDVVGAYLERSFYFSGAHLSRMGGSLMNADGLPEFNDEVGLEWVRLMQKFETAGLVEFSGDNDLQYFKEQRAGLIIESSRLRDELIETLGSSNLAIDPWPALDRGEMSGYVQAENIYLNPRALGEKGHISWKFIEHMLKPEAQLAMVETGSIPALTIDAFKAGQILIDDDLIRQAIIALSGGTAYPVLPEMSVYPPVLDTALRSIFSGENTPDQGLQFAEDTITSALSALTGTATPIP